MKQQHVFTLLFCFFLILFSSNLFAQLGHSLQIDDGSGHFSIIKSGNPGATFLLPPGPGTFTLLTSGNVWTLGGNTGAGSNNQLGTLDATALQFVTGGVSNVRMSISAGGIVSIDASLTTDPAHASGWTNNLRNTSGGAALQIGTAATADGYLVHASNLVTNNAANNPTPADGYSVYKYTGTAYTGAATLPGVSTAGKIVYVINGTSGNILVNTAGAGTYTVNVNFAGVFISDGTSWYPIAPPPAAFIPFN